MERVRIQADANTWMHLPLPEKAALYVVWANDPLIGGFLRNFMSQGEIHRYLKDTLLKAYAIERMSSPATPFAILGIPAETPISKTWIKPHGVALADRRVVAWAAAEQWKFTIIAVYERARSGRNLHPYAALLFNADGRFADEAARGAADEAGRRLGLERVVWTP